MELKLYNNKLLTMGWLQSCKVITYFNCEKSLCQLLDTFKRLPNEID